MLNVWERALGSLGVAWPLSGNSCVLAFGVVIDPTLGDDGEAALPAAMVPNFNSRSPVRAVETGPAGVDDSPPYNSEPVLLILLFGAPPAAPWLNNTLALLTRFPVVSSC